MSCRNYSVHWLMLLNINGPKASHPKNIIIKACAVTITLYNWVFPNNNKLPGLINSHRIKIDNHKPANPFKIPKIKYKTPISL